MHTLCCCVPAGGCLVLACNVWSCWLPWCCCEQQGQLCRCCGLHTHDVLMCVALKVAEEPSTQGTPPLPPNVAAVVSEDMSSICKDAVAAGVHVCRCTSMQVHLACPATCKLLSGTSTLRNGASSSAATTARRSSNSMVQSASNSPVPLFGAALPFSAAGVCKLAARLITDYLVLARNHVIPVHRDGCCSMHCIVTMNNCCLPSLRRTSQLNSPLRRGPLYHMYPSTADVGCRDEGDAAMAHMVTY